MRKKLFLSLALFSFANLTLTAAHATPLPIGTYSFSVETGTGVHGGSDEGTLSGALTFDPASNLTAADLLFDDTTTGTTFSFTEPGATEIDPGEFLSAIIYNAVDPLTQYHLWLRLPGNPDGSFTLTCGTDCHTWMDLNESGTSVYDELNFGTITPAASAVPEPSSLFLIGTGAVGILTMLHPRSRRYVSSIRAAL